MKTLRLIQQRFDRASKKYNQTAALYRHVNEQLLKRLDIMRIQPQRILDLGSGTGLALEALQKKYPNAHVIALDLSHGMLKQSGRKKWFKKNPSHVQADIMQLPFPNQSVDFIFSSLAFHWCADWGALFTEMQRVLKPEGLLIFSTVGPDTLLEIKTAWATVDDLPHANGLLDFHDVGDILVKGRWQAPVLEAERCVLTYPDPKHALSELINSGAQNSHPDRQRGLMSKAKFKAFMQAFSAMKNPAGKTTLTYEIIYAHAWAPTEMIQLAHDGEVSVPITSIGRRRAIQ